MKQPLEERAWRYVVFFNWYRSDPPVYHYWKTDDDGKTAFTESSECGRAISFYAPWMPERFAAKFARPCKGCFDVDG